MQRFVSLAASAALLVIAAGPVLAQVKVETPQVKVGGQGAVGAQVQITGIQPLHNIPSVQKALNITDQQVQKLNSTYNDALKVYQNTTQKVGNIADQAGNKAIQDARNTMQQGFIKNAATILDQKQAQVFSDLQSKLGGMTFVTDSAVMSKLNLSAAQQSAMTTATTAFNNKVAKLDWSNPERALTTYHQLLPDLRKDVNAALSDEQRAVFNLVNGPAFSFVDAPRIP